MSTSSRPYYVFFCLIVLLGLFFRMVLIYNEPFKAADSIGYDRLGINLSRGNGFSTNLEQPFLPEIRRGPLYPTFLAGIYSLFGHRFVFVMLFQVVLDTMTCLLLFLALRRFMNSVFSLSVFAIISFYPFTAYYCATILSETLSTFLLSLSFFLWIFCSQNKKSDRRPILLFSLGLTLGLNILCKSALVFLPWLVAFSFLYAHMNVPSMKKAFLIIFGCYLIVLPWTLRNFIVFDKFIPVRTGFGQALWVGAGEAAGAVVVENKADANMEAVYRKFLETKESRKAIEYDRLLKKAALKKIRRAPFSLIKRSIRNAFRIWISMYHYEMNPYVIYGARIGSFAILILAMWGLFSSCSIWNRMYPLMLIIAYFSIVHSPLHIEARYSIPARPYLLVFTCYGLFKLMGLIYGKHAVRQPISAPLKGEEQAKSISPPLMGGEQGEGDKIKFH